MPDLLRMPLTQMTGEELVRLIKGSYGLEHGASHVLGLTGLADYLGCGITKVYNLKSSGVLDDAIISKIGKRIVFDAPKARELAMAYDEERHRQRYGRPSKSAADFSNLSIQP